MDYISDWTALKNILSYASEADPATVDPNTISIMSPFFSIDEDIQAGAGSATQLYWSKSGWLSGTHAEGPYPDDQISSFDVLDDLVGHYTDKEMYPNLQVRR
jgi:hypothetical protein